MADRERPLWPVRDELNLKFEMRFAAKTTSAQRDGRGYPSVFRFHTFMQPVEGAVLIGYEDSPLHKLKEGDVVRVELVTEKR